MADSAAFDKLDMTSDELQSLEKALKDEKFRKMLIEYAEELRDPENRRKYEEEITQMEQNRGMDVTFINPDPGYVLKTNNGEKKVFINLCKSDKVAQPKATVAHEEENGVRKPGISWSMPYSLAPGREDLDKDGKTCMVYDVVFHPMCFDHAAKDPRVSNLMEQTALDGIQREFNEKLDRTNLKKPKIKFKGQVQPTIIRTPNAAGPNEKDADAVSSLNLPYPYNDKSGPDSKSKPANAPAKSSSKISGNRNGTKMATEPKYTITHRGHFDIQQFTNARDSAPSTRPQELVIRVELPLLKSAAPVQLDVYERQIVLESKKPVAYKLDLPLPFPVDEENGSAKFDKSRSCLIITVPVQPPEIPELPSFAPEVMQEKPLVEEIKPAANQDDVNRDEKEERGDKETADAKSGDCDDINNAKPNHGALEEKESAQSDEQLLPENKVSEEKNNNISKDDKVIKPTSAPTPSSAATASDNDDKVPQESTSPDDTSCTPLGNQDVNFHQGLTNAICPNYSFKQDSESITFIVQQAQDIDPKSIHKKVCITADQLCTVRIQFRTKSFKDENESALIKSYTLCVQFDDGCVVQGGGGGQPEELKVEVTETGAVVVMRKSEECRGDWCGFKAGVSPEELKVRLGDLSKACLSCFA